MVGVNPWRHALVDVEGRRAQRILTRTCRYPLGMRLGGEHVTQEMSGKRREQKAEAAEAGGAKGRGVLYWLRQDFRLHDNPALSAAAQAAKKQVSAFCHLHLCEHCNNRNVTPFASCTWRKVAWQRSKSNL